VEIFFCILLAALVTVHVYANYKKRNGIIWLFLSILITPPLAFLILLIMGSRPITKIRLIVLACVICLFYGLTLYLIIPLNKTQLIKAKMIEVVNSMSNVASAVEAYKEVYNDDLNSWPHCDGVIAIRTSLGVNIPTKRSSSILVTSQTAEEVIITATIKGIDSRVDGKNLILTGKRTERDILWVWGGTVPSTYVPRN
jgi:uncharacterized membrane protein